MPASVFGELIDLMSQGTISANTGKKLTAMVFEGDTRSLKEVGYLTLSLLLALESAL